MADVKKYSDEMASSLARALLDGATAETRIAVVSTPSVFVALKNVLVSLGRSNIPSFTFYD